MKNTQQQQKVRMLSYEVEVVIVEDHKHKNAKRIVANMKYRIIGLWL